MGLNWQFKPVLNSMMKKYKLKFGLCKHGKKKSSLFHADRLAPFELIVISPSMLWP